MAGLGAGDGPLVHGAAQNGAVDTVWRGGLSCIFAVDKMVTLGGNAFGED